MTSDEYVTYGEADINLKNFKPAAKLETNDNNHKSLKIKVQGEECNEVITGDVINISHAVTNKDGTNDNKYRHDNLMNCFVSLQRFDSNNDEPKPTRPGTSSVEEGDSDLSTMSEDIVSESDSDWEQEFLASKVGKGPKIIQDKNAPAKNNQRIEKSILISNRLPIILKKTLPIVRKKVVYFDLTNAIPRSSNNTQSKQQFNLDLNEAIPLNSNKTPQSKQQFYWDLTKVIPVNSNDAPQSKQQLHLDLTKSIPGNSNNTPQSNQKFHLGLTKAIPGHSNNALQSNQQFHVDLTKATIPINGKYLLKSNQQTYLDFSKLTHIVLNNLPNKSIQNECIVEKPTQFLNLRKNGFQRKINQHLNTLRVLKPKVPETSTQNSKDASESSKQLYLNVDRAMPVKPKDNNEMLEHGISTHNQGTVMSKEVNLRVDLNSRSPAVSVDSIAKDNNDAKKRGMVETDLSKTLTFQKKLLAVSCKMPNDKKNQMPQNGLKDIFCSFYRRKVKRRAKNFLCHLCGKAFKCSEYLEGHVNMHLNRRPYKCTDCDKCFYSVHSQQMHHTAIHQKTRAELKFLCVYCGYETTSRSHIAAHEAAHVLPEGSEIPKPFKCSKCDKGFISNFFMKRHTREQHIGKKCHKCSEMFENRCKLKTHLKKVHEIKSDKRVNCTICNKSMFSSGLHTHMSFVHTAPKFFCDICDKGFKLKHQIEQHMITHSDNRPIACDQCGERFKRKTHLKQHLVARHGVTGAKRTAENKIPAKRGRKKKTVD